MKFLYFTDTHIKGTNPKNRKDNYYQTLINKFNEIIELCEIHNIDYVLHGGDWFDRPDTSPAIVREFSLLIKKINRPIFTIAGNHDIYGQNKVTISRTMLGLMDGIGIIRLIDYNDNNCNEVFLEKNNIKVQLIGSSYRYDIDNENKDAYIVKKDKNVDYTINIVHGMLLDFKFMNTVQYTHIDQIINTEADLTLAGHYHAGFGIHESNGKIFANPGSLTRISNSNSEISRMPKVIVIDLSKRLDVFEIELKCALKGSEVLDRSALNENLNNQFKINEFYNMIKKSTNFKKISIKEIIENISISEKIEKEVKEEAFKRISIASELLKEDN